MISQQRDSSISNNIARLYHLFLKLGSVARLYSYYQRTGSVTQSPRLGRFYEKKVKVAHKQNLRGSFKKKLRALYCRMDWNCCYGCTKCGTFGYVT